MHIGKCTATAYRYGLHVYVLTLPVGLLWKEDLLPLSCIVYGMEVVAGGAVWGVYTN